MNLSLKDKHRTMDGHKGDKKNDGKQRIIVKKPMNSASTQFVM